jgi:hypothetical protein
MHDLIIVFDQICLISQLIAFVGAHALDEIVEVVMRLVALVTEK